MIPAWTGAAVGVCLWIADRLRDARGGKRRDAPPPTPWPIFAPEQAGLFTREAGGVRAFDPDRAEEIRWFLRWRSARPIDLPDARVRAWEVGPISVADERASAIVDRLEARGAQVIGSLSLVFLNSGETCPMHILAAPDPADAARLLRPGGHLAVLVPALVPARPVATEAPPQPTAAKVPDVVPPEIAADGPAEVPAEVLAAPAAAKISPPRGARNGAARPGRA